MQVVIFITHFVEELKVNLLYLELSCYFGTLSCLPTTASTSQILLIPTIRNRQTNTEIQLCLLQNPIYCSPLYKCVFLLKWTKSQTMKENLCFTYRIQRWTWPALRKRKKKNLLSHLVLSLLFLLLVMKW